MCEQLSVSECEPDECLGRVLLRAGKALSLAGPGALDLPSSHLCFGIENIKKHKPGSCSLYSEHVEAQFIVLFIVRNAWLSWIVKSGAPLSLSSLRAGPAGSVCSGAGGQVVGARRLCRSSGDQAADLTSGICGQSCFWWTPNHHALLQETKWEEPHASLSLVEQLKPGQTSVHPGET